MAKFSIFPGRDVLKDFNRKTAVCKIIEIHVAFFFFFIIMQCFALFCHINVKKKVESVYRSFKIE